MATSFKGFRIKSFKKYQPIVSLKKVCLSFGKRNILNNINFNIPAGVSGLLGPNGAGKSSIFNLISGLLKPNSGSIYFGNTNATEYPIYLRTRMYHLGMVPQSGGTFSSLTITENLRCIGEVLIDNKRELDSKINYLIDKFKLGAVKDIKVQNLSGGEKRKTTIAAALLGDPKVLLCDEPFSQLDVLTIQMLQEIICDLQKDYPSMAIVVADHQPRELLAICDRAFILSNQTIIAEGSPNSLLRNQEARKHYFGHDWQY